MRTPMGFKYLAMALIFSLALGASYLMFFMFPGSIIQCVPDFSLVRFARLVSNRDGRVHRLVDDVDGPFNHAYRKLGTQSETYGGGGVHGAFRATDGYIDSGTIAHTKDIEEARLDIDMGYEVDVRTVRVWNRNDELNTRLPPFSIMLAKVPLREDYSLKEAKKLSQSYVDYDQVQNLYVWNLTKPVTARYVRLQVHGKQFLHVHEVEVFDTLVPDGYRFKPTYIQTRNEAPLVSIPTNFAAFLPIAGHVLNLTSPVRLFDHTSREITAQTYTEVISSPGKTFELHVSEGEDFVGEFKACIVFLVTDGTGYNTNADYLTEVFSNLEILSANLFKVYQYDVIIFYSWAADQVESNKERFVRSFPHLKIRFSDVSRHFPPTLPQHLIDNKVDMSLFEKGTDCAPGNNWRLNYLHMGRFWSTKLWLEPMLKEYDYVWRLDADATIDKPLTPGHFFFLREMWAKKKLFAYWCRFGDTDECDTGILEAAEAFAEKKGLKFKHKDKIGPNTAYWGGFGVYATKFFCYNKDWLEYVDYLDSLGGHYNHRWGEQNVFPYSLSLFMEFNELYWVRNKHIQIFHDHEPMPNCAGVDRDGDLNYVMRRK